MDIPAKPSKKVSAQCPCAEENSSKKLHHEIMMEVKQHYLSQKKLDREDKP
jgi:hypothetical protein